MNYLFIDTETTGLPKRHSNPIKNPENWPHMVQIAWILSNEEGSLLDEQSHIIYPDGFEIPDVVAHIHGITTIRAKHEGKPLSDVLGWFSKTLCQTDLVVGHNIMFDRGVIAAECIRTGLEPALYLLPSFCTMKRTADICHIPYPSGKKGNKWPKLTELHQVLFSESFEGAHDALTDVRACVRCFFELKKRGILDTQTL